MSINRVDPSVIVGMAGALFQIAEMFDEYEDRRLDKRATETTIGGLLRLYQQGKMTREDFLKTVSLIIKQQPSERQISLKDDLLAIVSNLPD